MRIEPCILGTACIPWNADYTFAEEIFRRQIRALRAEGLENLYIFGTAGEGHAVTNRQFEQIAGVFFDEMRDGGGLCQLGVIGLSVPQVRERIEIGLRIGYRMFQISFPSWGKVNDRECRDFFDQILGSYPQAAFLHYNVARGLRKLTGREYARIAADHANLVATKNSSQHIGTDLDLVLGAPQLCHFLGDMDYPMASMFAPCGLLISIGTIHTARGHELFEAGRSRNYARLVELMAEMHGILELLMESTASGQHMDGAYDKIFSKMLVPDFPLRLLPPYQSTSDEEFERFVTALKTKFPNWSK